MLVNRWEDKAGGGCNIVAVKYCGLSIHKEKSEAIRRRCFLLKFARISIISDCKIYDQWPEQQSCFFFCCKNIWESRSWIICMCRLHNYLLFIICKKGLRKDLIFEATCQVFKSFSLRDELLLLMVDAFRPKIIFHISSLQRIKDCILRQLKEHPRTPILKYIALWQWQHIVMANAASLCPGITPGDLKTIGKSMNQDCIVRVGVGRLFIPVPLSKIKSREGTLRLFYTTNQHEIIAKHLTYRKFLLWRDACVAALLKPSINHLWNIPQAAYLITGKSDAL